MTRFLFFLISFLILAILSLCCFVLRLRNSSLKKALFSVNLVAFFSVVFQILSLQNFNLNLNFNLALVFNGFYYASIDWLLLFFINYLFVFTDTPVKSTSVTVFFQFSYLVVLTDSIALITNAITGYVFDILPCVKNSEFYCWNFDYHHLFFMHIGICYILVALILYGLIKKIIITNKFFRMKFIVIFLIFLSAVAIDSFWLAHDDCFNISIFLFGIFAIFATYYSFYSEPKKVEAKMLQLVTENINNGVLCFDLNKNCIYANKTGKKFFISKSAAENELENLLASSKEFLLRNLEINQDGKKSVLSEEFYVLRDSNQNLLGYFISFENVTESLNLIDAEKFRSSHDLLTGLLNRANFFLNAEKRLKKAPEDSFYFVCSDVLNFKLINDLFGASVGDEVLKKYAGIFKKIVGGSDSVFGRISNDRFAAIVKKDEFSPLNAAEKIKRIPPLLNEYNYKIHFRIGVYEISDPYETINSMYDKAEMAIRKNENLEDVLSYYDASMMKSLFLEKSVVSAFEQALKENQFAMYLQPQVSSRNGKVAGAEALVRWIHPEKGVLFPDSFVPILENAGLLYKLDLYIWELAVKKLAEWKERGIDMYIAVNISAKDFYNLDLYQIFTGLVEKYKIEPEKLKLEITETVFMHDIRLHTQVLSKLQNYGFSIEMDDFGSGYSSLNMLRNLTFDILKIDMFFLSQPKNTEKSKLILNRIIKMAKELGLTVISEGIENEENAEFLRESGCDYFQGYLYSKPVSVTIFEKRYVQGGK